MFHRKGFTADARLQDLYASEAAAEPPYPPRDRTRSPRGPDRLHIRLQEVLAAHRRNTSQRRGGRKGQAARRTRAIHRHILDIFVQLLGHLLDIAGAGDPGRQQLVLRRDQAQERLDFLQTGFPEDKFTVLPDLREHIREHPHAHQWETVSIDSCSVNDALEVPEDISEEEQEGSAEWTGPFSDPLLRERWQRLVANPERYRELEREVLTGGPVPASIQNLPQSLRGGARVGGSSASSAPARPELLPTPKGSPVTVPPLLQLQPKAKAKPKAEPSSKPKAKPKPSTKSPSVSSSVPKASTALVLSPRTAVPTEVPTIVIEAESSAPEFSELVNLQLSQPLGTLPEGSEVDRLTYRLSRVPILSLDFHRVLDSVQVSNRLTLRTTEQGELHPRVCEVLRATIGNPFAQIVLSYCHHKTTRDNVKRACWNRDFLNGAAISDKPVGRFGKLAVLEQIITEEALCSRRVYHLDDSEEVLGELLQYSQIVPVGIRVRGKRNFRQVEGVRYFDCVFDAIEFCLEQEQQYS